MLIDCDSCAIRDVGCADCMVTALLGPVSALAGEPAVDLADDEAQALDVLAAAGLLPPLRLVRRTA